MATGDDYLAMVQAAREEDIQQAGVRPSDCPIDGTTLLEDPQGNLRCPFDGWVWDGRTPWW